MEQGFHLSPQQLNIWNHGNGRKLSYCLLKLSIDINQGKFEDACRFLFEKYEIFQTRFPVSKYSDVPLQVVTDFKFHCIRTEPNFSSQDELLAWCDFYAAQHQIESGVELLRLHHQNEQYAVLFFHALTVDNMAVNLLVEQLNQVSMASNCQDAVELFCDNLPYIEASEWTNELLTSSNGEKGLKFWRNVQFLDYYQQRSMLEAVNGGNSHMQRTNVFKLQGNLLQAISAYSEKYNISAGAIITAVWCLVLNQYQLSDKTVIGYELSGRSDNELATTVGPLSRDIPLKTEFNKQTRGHDLIQAVATFLDDAKVLQECFSWQHYILDTNTPPFFPYRIARKKMVNRSTMAADIELVETKVVAPPFYITLNVEFHDTEDEIHLQLEFDSNQVNTQQVSLLEAQILGSIRQIIENPYHFLHDLNVIPESQQAKLLSSNSCAGDFSFLDVVTSFEQQADRTPDKIALVCQDDQLSYAQVREKAVALAEALLSMGLKEGDFVGVCVPRSIYSVVSILAVWKAGAVYVPLDPSYPENRLEYIVQDSKMKFIVTSESLATELFYFDGGFVYIEKLQSNIYKPAHTRTSIPLSREAYLIYTSGSTGNPKGTLVSHQALAEHCSAIQIHYGLTHQDRGLLFAPFNFDPSLEQSIPYLTCGATVIVRENVVWNVATLTEKIEQLKLSVVNLPTAYWHLLVEHWEQESTLKTWITSLRLMICGGDKMQPSMVKRWHKLDLTGIRLLNAYGPTEATITALTAELDAETVMSMADLVPIGKPLPYRQVWVLNEDLKCVPSRCQGELYIGGACLADGYLNLPEVTTERFITNPYYDVENTSNSIRLYKTGDLVRYLPDGNIEFIGRNDDQVKIRGFRIELGEVEVQLVQIPQIDSAVVVAAEVAGSLQLVGYIKPAHVVLDSEVAAYVASVRHEISRYLPEHMVPSIIIRVNEWPQTLNGKLDKKALPVPSACLHQSDYIAPETDIERMLVEIWAKLLGVDVNKISTTANFFELGGHSLLMIKLVGELQKNNHQPRATELYRHLQLRDMASYLDGLEAKSVYKIPPNYINGQTVLITPDMLPLIELTQAEIDRIVSATPGGISNIQDIYPLSPLQESIFFLHQATINKVRDPYVSAFAFECQSELALKHFIAAIEFIIARHDVLRTTVLWRNFERPIQVVMRSAELPIKYIASHDMVCNLDSVRAYVEQGAFRLDLEHAPLLQLEIISSEESEPCFVIMKNHHLMSDHVSLEIIIDELNSFRQGNTAQLQLPTPYRNFIAGILTPAKSEDVEEFFTKMLQKAEEPSLLFGVGNIINDGEGALKKEIALDNDISQKIRTTMHQHQSSPAVFFHAAWAILVANCTNLPYASFGTVLTGRMSGQAGIENAIGMMINTLPLTVSLSNLTVSQLITQVKETLHLLLRFEQVPLAKAQKFSGIEGAAPLFNSTLNYRHSKVPLISKESTDAFFNGELSLVREVERTSYPISLSVNDFGDANPFTFNIDVDSTIDVEQFERYWRTVIAGLLDGLLAEEQVQATSLSVLSLPEIDHLITELNHTVINYPKDKYIHELFEQQANNHPDNVAVVIEQEQLTYRQLNEKANQLAHYLVEKHQVGPDTLVGLCVSRSLEMVLGILAILKAGGAYVPLDPSYPQERLHYMLEDAKLGLVLGDQHASAVLSDFNGDILCINQLVGSTQTQFDKYPLQNLTLQGSGTPATRLAYVIYTSGSTGNPKGVLTPHISVVRLLVNQQFMALNSETVMMQSANIAFDAATLELWGPLLNGGKIVLYPELYFSPELLNRQIDKHQVNTLWLTAGFFKVWAAEVPESSSLTQLVAGGDALDLEAIKRVQRALPLLTLINGYGPTENTTFSTTYTFDKPHQQNAVPIGKRLITDETYILDSRLKLVPGGSVGELFVGGDGLALGYLNRPELTAERFVKNPFFDANNTIRSPRLYRTGDLVRYLRDGNMEFVGRIDDQVKIRGFRIELGEVETQLAQLASVESALVVTAEYAGIKKLVGYVKPSVAIEAKEQDRFLLQIKTLMMNAVPEYMVPSCIMLVEYWPLTPNGKIDRKALPAAERFVVQDNYVALETETEYKLASIWADLLNVTAECIGGMDNFFELGGHSLIVVMLQVRIKEQFKVHLDIDQLFEYAMLRRLAMIIDKQVNSCSNIPWPVIKANNLTEAPPSSAQQSLWLLEQVNGSSSAYNVITAVRIKGNIDIRVLGRCLNEVERRHETLRTTYDFIGGNTQQKIQEFKVFETPFSNLQLLDKELQEQKCKDAFDTEFEHIFDLAAGPVWRSHILQLASNEAIIMINMHHICTDGWSMRILLQEMKVIYQAFIEGKPSPLPNLDVNYSDYAIWQKAYKETSEYQNDVNYWKVHLKNIPELSPIPRDYEHPEIPSNDGNVLPIMLNKCITDKLRERTNQLGCTPFVFLMSAYKLLLAIESGKEDIIVGTDIACRKDASLEKLIGFFVNQVALRTQVKMGMSVKTFINDVKNELISGMKHGEVNFEHVVSSLNVKRNPRYAPIFQTKFFMEKVSEVIYEHDDFEFNRVSFEKDVARLDVTVGLIENDSEINGTLVFNTAILKESTAKRMVHRFISLVNFMIADPQTTLQNVKIKIIETEKKLAKVEQKQFIENRVNSFKMGTARKSVGLDT